MTINASANERVGRAQAALRVADGLRDDFRGSMLLRRDPTFAAAATIWNAAAQHNPTAIFRCSDVRDVQMVVRRAAEEGALAAVRCGGHSLAGYSSCEDGLVIDLSGLREARVDPAARRARVQGGCLLGTIDRATSDEGLVFPAGVVSHTGASGLILGGGTGWLTRKFGLSCDNIENCTLVSANGEIIHASERDNADLFWALRGGGGNFGVVIEFTLRLHPLRSVLLGTGMSLGEDVMTALSFWRDFMPSAAEDMKWNLSLVVAPDEKSPTVSRHRIALTHAALWTGQTTDGLTQIDQIFSVCMPVNRATRAIPYLELQTMADSEFPHGDRYYSKSGYFHALDDDTISTMIEAMESAPSAKTQIELAYLGGAASRVGASETSFGDRSSPFIMNLLAQWKESKDDAVNVGWVRETFTRLRPKMRPGVYVNFMSGDEGDRTREVYGGGWERLLSVKRKYDPNNFFRLNQNITDHAAAAQK